MSEAPTDTFKVWTEERLGNLPGEFEALGRMLAVQALLRAMFKAQAILSTDIAEKHALAHIRMTLADAPGGLDSNDAQRTLREAHAYLKVILVG